MYRTPPCASTANRWSFFSSLFSRAAMRHRSAPCSPVDRHGSVDTTSSPFRMRLRPHAAPASVGTRESNADQGPTVNRRSSSMARVTTPLWMVAKPWSFWLEAMVVLVVSALRDSDHQVVRPSGFVRSPSCPPFGVRQIKLSALRDLDPPSCPPFGVRQIYKLSALRDSDHQVVRPSGFVRSSCPPFGIQIPKLSALRGSSDHRCPPFRIPGVRLSALRWEQCLHLPMLSSPACPVWRELQAALP